MGGGEGRGKRGCRRGRDHMVIGFMHSVPITTKVVSSNPIHSEMYSMQYFMIKFVRDLQQIDGFLQVLPFPPPIKLIATI